MEIDWFIVIAQIINFLILVILLKLLLYKPIIRIMDQREEKITSQLKEAEEKISIAQEEKENYQKERQLLERKRSEMLEKARDEADEFQKQLFHEAREAVEQSRHRWMESIEREKEDFLADLRQRMSHQANEIARHALQDMADADLEQRMIEVFLLRILDLPEDKQADIAAAIRTSDDQVLIRTVFELPQDLREKVVTTLEENLLNGDQIDPQFETTPDLISGIELLVHGHRVAWTLEDYMQSLEEKMGLVIEEKRMETTQNNG
ncbi:MAG: F0F1 ATP synthase subunit B [Anaerolineales bacterium]|nr:F0F1 ATP synthase subunit B [Anaerolineales bacterium]